MPTSITLVAPANHYQSTDLPDSIASLVGDADMRCVEPASAWDVTVAECSEEHAMQWRTAANAEGMDCFIQPADGRDKKLLLSDMDSTIIEQECVDELAAFIGLKDKVAAITEQAMRGELDFESALTERVALLKGLNVTVVDELLRDVITLSPGAVTLIQTMRKHGCYCVLVSGGFTLFTEAIGEICGFHDHASNLLLQDGAVLLGDVQRPILGQEAKLERLRSEQARLDIRDDEIIAIGDGANDLPMLEAAGLGIAYRAKPAVRECIANQINHTDLTSLLYAAGIPKQDWVR